MINLKLEEENIVRAILNRYLPVTTKIYIYGSRVTGKARPYSDLDIAIDKSSQKLSLKEEASLTDDFVESDLPFKVDIVDWNKLSTDFQSIIKSSYVNFNIK